MTSILSFRIRYDTLN